MRMYVYASKTRNFMGELTPICVETNLEFALKYWSARKLENTKIFWVIK